MEFCNLTTSPGAPVVFKIRFYSSILHYVYLDYF